MLKVLLIGKVSYNKKGHFYKVFRWDEWSNVKPKINVIVYILKSEGVYAHAHSLKHTTQELKSDANHVYT